MEKNLQQHKSQPVRQSRLSRIKLVFVVCSGRSGSTLLQSIFDAHPNICAPVESKFVLHLATKYGKLTRWDEKTISRFCDDLYTNRRFRLFWNVDKKQLRDLFARYPVRSFQDACKVVYLSYPSFFEKGDIKVIADKNPLYAGFLNEIQTIFSDAKFIHLVRDPRAVYFSRRKAFNEKNGYRQALAWKMVQAKIRQYEKHHSKKIMKVKYENLVADPEVQLKGILDFLDLPFKQVLLSGHKVIAENIEGNAYLRLTQHRNITNPINRESMDAWREELGAKKMKIIQNLTFEQAKEFGYTFEKGKLPAFGKFQKMLAKIELVLFHGALSVLFKLPFWWRKQLYNLVSVFFDKKYK